MKKISIVSIMFLFLVSMSACGQNAHGIEPISNEPSEIIASSSAIVKTKATEPVLIDIGVNYELVTKSICTETTIDFVRQLVPQLISNECDFSDVNQLICEQIINYLSRFDTGTLSLSDESKEWEWDHDAYERFALSGGYQIKSNNNHLISFVLNGMWNVKAAAHPTHFCLGIIIDLDTHAIVDVRSMYDFNEEFLELFLTNKSEWVVRQGQEEVFDTIDYFNSRLLSKFSTDEETSFYFTENKLGVILNGLPFAVGDYCAIEIPYEDIAQFKK